MTQALETPTARFLRPPSACGDEFDKVTWSGTVAVHLSDDLLLGLRFNNAGLQTAVAEALGERVADAAEPTPYYSVRVGTPGRRKAAPLHYLYLGGRPVLGTRDLTRLVRGIGNHVSAHLPATSRGYVVDAIPVRTPCGVMLVPQEILSMARAIDTVLTPAGFAFADVPRAELDLDTGSVVVPQPAVALDVAPERLAGVAPSVAEDRLEPGRYPLTGWLLAVKAPSVGELRPAEAAFYAARQLDPPFPAGAQAALDGIVALAARVPMLGITWTTHDEMVEQVLRAGTRCQ